MWKFFLAGVALIGLTNFANAACPTPLANGTTADATQVMNWLYCRAPLDNPLFNGMVGIGTSSAQDTLDLGNGTGGRGITWGASDGSGRYTNMYTAYGTGGLVLAAGFKGSTTNDIYLSTHGSSIARAGIRLNSYNPSPGTIQFFTDPSSTNPIGTTVTPTERMRIDSSGNVGIGTTSPAYMLHVNGTAYATGAAGALSDIRHKADIRDLKDGALADVMQLRPVSFRWKRPADNGMDGAQIGFIAQDVEKVLPTVVITERNAERTKGLKYNELVAILAKAIQEEQAEIRDLSAQIEELRRQLRTQTAKR